MFKYIDIALIVILSVTCLLHLIRGFVGSLKPFRKWCAIAVAWMLKNPLAAFVRSFLPTEGWKTSIYNRAYSLWGESINEVSVTPNAHDPEAYNGIFGFVGRLFSDLGDKCVSAVREGVMDVAHSISGFIADNVLNFILQIICFIVIFILTMLALSAVVGGLDMLCKNNGFIGHVNKLLGALIGVIVGFLVVWMLSLALYLISPELVEKTTFALWMCKSFFLSYIFGIG